MCFKNLAATTRSTIFDRKVKFDIGRYELGSSGSSFGFFKSGRTTACFCEGGSTPVDNDALHKRLMTGTNTAADFFISQVGTGSRSQCFGGNVLRMFTISSVVTSSKFVRHGTSRYSMSGSGTCAVAARIQSTFALK